MPCDRLDAEWTGLCELRNAGSGWSRYSTNLVLARVRLSELIHEREFLLLKEEVNLLPVVDIVSGCTFLDKVA